MTSEEKEIQLKNRQREYYKKYCVSHKEELSAYFKEYYKNHKAEYLLRSRKQELNPKRKEYRKKYKETHKKEYFSYSMNWRKRNPEKSRLVRAVVNANRYARNYGNTERISREELTVLFKEANYTCRNCGLTEPQIKLTVDHIFPLSRGGRNRIWNIQFLCVSCNTRKLNKLPSEIQTY